jgi:hypothetical protein
MVFNPALEEAGEAGFSLQDPGVGAIVRCPGELGRALVLVCFQLAPGRLLAPNGGMGEVGAWTGNHSRPGGARAAR